MLYVCKTNEEEVMNLRGSGGKWKKLEEKEKYENYAIILFMYKIPF